VNIRIVQQYLGHASLVNTMIYLHGSDLGNNDAAGRIHPLAGVYSLSARNGIKATPCRASGNGSTYAQSPAVQTSIPCLQTPKAAAWSEPSAG